MITRLFLPGFHSLYYIGTMPRFDTLKNCFFGIIHCSTTQLYCIALCAVHKELTVYTRVHRSTSMYPGIYNICTYKLFGYRPFNYVRCPLQKVGQCRVYRSTSIYPGTMEVLDKSIGGRGGT